MPFAQHSRPPPSLFTNAPALVQTGLAPVLEPPPALAIHWLMEPKLETRQKLPSLPKVPPGSPPHAELTLALVAKAPLTLPPTLIPTLMVPQASLPVLPSSLLSLPSPSERGPAFTSSATRYLPSSKQSNHCTYLNAFDAQIQIASN